MEQREVEVSPIEFEPVTDIDREVIRQQLGRPPRAVRPRPARGPLGPPTRAARPPRA
ncbi:DUF501 domain-containing protein, partial [Saccharomonospora xinjiangensis]